jgi:hypothetical protein
MKATQLFTFFVLVGSALVGVPALAQEVVETASPEEVMARRANAKAAFGKAGTVVPDKPIAISEDRPTLFEQSDFLVGVHGYTILPKGAVISVGKSVQLVSSQPRSGKLLDWNSFVRSHRGGLRLIPISDGQWTGTDPLDSLKPTLEAASESGLTCLLSLNGQPVSIPGIQELLSPEK